MNSQTPASRTNDKQSVQPASAKISPPNRKAKSATNSPSPAISEPQKNEQPKSNRFDKVGSAEGFQMKQPQQQQSQQQPMHQHNDAKKETTFRFEAPSAHEVLLAADFTNWEKQPIKLMKGGGGTWHAKIALSPGRHHYKFVVDGKWCDDPHCSQREANPYGSANSVVEIA